MNEITNAVGSVNDVKSSNSSAVTTLKDKKAFETNDELFIQLLTTQLRHQDPTKPMDANEFTQQLVSLSQVQQSVATNEKLSELISLNKASQTSNTIFSSAALIGKTVSANGDSISLRNGFAEFTYSLSENANSTFIKIKDENGRTVHTSEGETDAGKHSFTWNGTDTIGNKLKDGSYSVEVSALDSSNNAVSVVTTVNGIVTGAITSDGSVLVEIDGTTVPIDNILSIKETTDSANNTGEEEQTDV